MAGSSALSVELCLQKDEAPPQIILSACTLWDDIFPSFGLEYSVKQASQQDHQT